MVILIRICLKKLYTVVVKLFKLYLIPENALGRLQKSTISGLNWKVMAKRVKNIGGDKKGINEGKNVSTWESHF